MPPVPVFSPPDPEKPLRIVSLTAENIKRIKAVQITPTGDLVVIGGKNGQGKSSTLDCIAYALGGKEAICEQPLRQGTDAGHIVLDLGDIIVRRTFTAEGGTHLTVKNKVGATFSSPQAMLDKLVGRLSFDPLAFARQKPAEQLATLKQLVGLDFTTQDAARKKLYDERTAVGAVGKSAKARLDALPPTPADTPESEVSIVDLSAQLQQINAQNQMAATWKARAAALHGRRADIQQLIGQLEAQLANARASLEQCTAEIAALGTEPPTLDPTPVRDQIAAAETTNRAVRAAATRRQLESEVAAAAAEWKRLSAAIDAIDATKAAMVAAVPMPVPGLSLNDTGVLLNGIPFAQASSAEQLRTSVAIGLALNPTLKIVLIRDGSLLDADNLKLIAEEAAKHDAQVWIERVGNGSEITVLIEDGEVAK